VKNKDGETVYQIYNITVYWTEGADPNPEYKYSDWQKYSPGRIKNWTSFQQMYKEETTLEQVQQKARQWWINYIFTKVGYRDKVPLAEKNPELLELKVEFLEWETWCLSWFSHYTYNAHLSDEALLDSFSRFVHRKEFEDWIVSQGPNDPLYKQAKEEGKYLHCLMGAEDRWRWKGPCRCPDCVKFGITRIDH